MKRKLQCILVDDEPSIHATFKKYLKDCEYAEITDYYQDPREFIKANKKPDLVFLDIIMPHIDGFSLADSIKPTPVIFFTGQSKRFRDIMNELGAIDAFPKPIIKERLIFSVKKAYGLLIEAGAKNDVEIYTHWEFNTLARKDKVFIKLKDIVYVTTHHDPRNKLVIMADGNEHVVTGYNMEEMLQITSHLLQPNKSELVSPDVIATHGFDHVLITVPNSEEKKMVVIGYQFSKIFKKRLLKN
jgi:DNA-binding LytR/AlgR family response regulator